MHGIQKLGIALAVGFSSLTGGVASGQESPLVSVPLDLSGRRAMIEVSIDGHQNDIDITPQNDGKARAGIDQQVARSDELLAVGSQLGLRTGHVGADGQSALTSCPNDLQESFAECDDVVGDLHGDAGQQ